jgi:uncharacterized iron-regulated protein
MKLPLRHILLGIFLITLLGACGVKTKKLMISETKEAYSEKTIISSHSGMPIPYSEMLADLKTAQVSYIGESHRDPHHHQFQLKVLKDLFEANPDLIVGMEMFDRTYQPILDQWSSGELDQEEFIQKSHWYANWKYNFDLYKDLLNFIKDNRIRLIGLNIPFHIPSKIAVGGVDSLLPDDQKHLPRNIDTTNTQHRDYVKKVFEHHHIRGKDDFEHFYTAQCVWEDIMAESIANSLNSSQMVVFLGNGHIIFKYGVPDRAYAHSQAPFRTVYLSTVGGKAELAYADYIWIGPSVSRRP